ncbi:MAG: tRNA pseudouridine(55) synthase TruB [Magnetococcales bacterium]|nr:tRNA pseudouridine(55) synthase TruB [Magnetococcales bacterium]
MSSPRRGKPLHGWLPLFKPAAMTSTGAVNRVRRLTGAAKAGHGGTLDPFAEGLLPIALGEATKTLSMVLQGDKGYRCWVRFGAETDTCDPEGEIQYADGRWPAPEALAAALERFVGEIDQVPPAHSAIHVDGERAYRKARRGELVILPSRRVRIHRLTLVDYRDGVAELTVRCGKGTYMRSLARDLARHLDCRGYLERLLRTETLGFTMEDSVPLDALERAVTDGTLHEVLLPVDRVLDDIPVLRLRAEAWHKIRNGQAVRLPAEGCPAGLVRLWTPEGRLAAIGELGTDADFRGFRSCRSKRLFNLD